MFVFDNITDLKKQLTANREEGLSIGFVPTMGALHKGHSSLIEQSLKENDITVCSIFVNPTQFNDKTDLKTYPRTLEADKKLLENTGCTILFVPSQVEIYPDALDGNTHTQSAMRNTDMHIRYKQVKLGKLDKVMEGASRHGHFDGVMQVVCRLFDIVEPDRAYFGQKDFQQQVIIKEMVRQLNYSIQIISCPIVREADGLAMSSRNMRLSDAERVAALIIPKTLFMVKSLSHKLSV
ncbi:MAG: pantoate--beta-alanine ligase, partial [Bacteroidia bacterium]|nr:pantoate--beta-alanine ligase [Bacteroidia bacterium]